MDATIVEIVSVTIVIIITIGIYAIFRDYTKIIGNINRPKRKEATRRKKAEFEAINHLAETCFKNPKDKE